MHVTAQDRLPPHVEEGLYRIAVEALNNALRHAQAHCISVSLSFAPEVTSLEVTDDGVGFDLSSVPMPGGLGLPGMAERAEQLGGTLGVDSRPGAGTRVTAVVPREAEQQEVPQ
jgi:signal transduction histidine kinase